MTVEDEAKLLQLERNKALAAVVSRFETLFANSPLSIHILDRNGKTLQVNPAWKKLWGLSDERDLEHVLKEYNVLTDPVVLQKNLLPYFQRALKGEIVQIPLIHFDPSEFRKVPRKRAIRSVICPVINQDGNVQELMLVHEDITDQHEDVENKQFLAGLGGILLQSLDYATTLEHIATACIPFFADGTVVDIIDDGEIRRFVTKHRDKVTERKMAELVSRFPPRMDSPQPTPRVIRSGKSLLMQKMDMEIIGNHTYDNDHARLIKSMGLKSHLAVPLVVRGEIVGALNFWINSDRRPFNEKDVQVGEGISRFAALAIDNARLYRDSQYAISQREDFISIASHELKTPVTALMLQMEIIQTILTSEDNLDKETLLKICSSASKQVERLSSLIEDMLDLTRVSRRNLVCDIKKMVPYKQLISDVLDRFSSQFDARGIQIHFHSQDDVFVECDPLRLEQVITNVITNALLYGQNRPIEVSMLKENGKVVCRIKDQGIGIAKNNLEKIFDRFERVHSATDGKGLGLGLYISRQIMTELGGRIFAESELGIGTTFIIELPDT